MTPRLFLALPLILCAVQAQAHPHIFVDTALHIDVDDAGQATGISVTWTYDDFFSLLIFEDMGLDPDGDAHLTQAELDKLRGFDMIEWPDGFEGDLYMFRNGEKQPLDFPEVTGIDVVDGRIVASHHRTFRPAPAEELAFLQYDPTFYVAYTVTDDVTADHGCRVVIDRVDKDVAAETVENLTKSDPEAMFEVLQLGIHYADTILLTCGMDG
ncbi:DUF1007 family protein [Mesobacterium sp. TK19101]|uniref:DUF1007 family protein n=1 Tax=Mesobacterium hydrothermale TaxID=3111907 RepID=A0ABU6HD36_9RHOB|nr:DUF1007 family protein [Mesobacterium sp. TK19101]MEC3860374.1 DUF1007 family protein [Mesobacterium sp. TK19101]